MQEMPLKNHNLTFEKLEKIILINKILHEDWSPLGKGVPRDEYLTYAETIYQFLEQNADEYFLGQYLDHINRNVIKGITKKDKNVNSEEKVVSFAAGVKIAQKLLKELSILVEKQDEWRKINSFNIRNSLEQLGSAMGSVGPTSVEKMEI